MTVLSIGTTHPRNVAGVGLDIRIGCELGVQVLTVVVAVSAQDERGLRALEAVSGETIRAQLDAIPWGEVASVRVGALTRPEIVYSIADALSTTAVPVVIDPVFVSSDGGTFAGAATIDVFRRKLLPLRNAVVTPNLDEAARLLDSDSEIKNAEQAKTAATILQSYGARAVLVKGGHLDGEPIDVLADGGEPEVFGGERVSGTMRGTGCTLAMALACALGRGDTLRDAVGFARGFVHDKLVKNAR